MAGEKRDTKRTGEFSELMVIAALARAGYYVSVPFGENRRYDAIIDRDNVLYRVQIKTGRFRNGVISYNTCSYHAHRNGRSRSYFGQVDYFGVYCPELDRSYLIPIAAATAAKGTLRVAATKNRQVKKLRWANDYLLETIPVSSVGSSPIYGVPSEAALPL